MYEPTKDASGAPNGRLELRVSVCCSERDVDVVVHGMQKETVGGLVEALAIEVGDPGETRIWCERRRRMLALDTALESSGIRWGDRLMLGPMVGEPTHVGGVPRFELVVSGGPCAGERFELGEGAFHVGRDAIADITIEDPSISRRHLDVVVDETSVSVADAGSSNGTALNGVALPVGESIALRSGDELELGRTMLRCRPIGSGPMQTMAPRDGRLDFNRPPRVSPPASQFVRELAAPPSRARKGHVSLAASLAPLALGVLLFVILKSPVMLVMTALSPVMALSTFISDRRGGRKSFARESADFRGSLEETLAERALAVSAETKRRREESPDAPALMARLEAVAPTLWERRPTDSDFLVLRLGVADLDSESSVGIKEGGDPELREEAEEKLRRTSTVPSVPLRLDVRGAGMVGLSGARSSTTGLARWLVVQATILHSPGEMVMMAALTPESLQDWEWLKWLPHLRPDRVGLQSSTMAVGRPQSEGLLAEIRDLARQRRGQTASHVTARPAQVLLLIDEDTRVDRALVSSALSDAADVGIAAIWLGHDPRDLPGQCGAIIESKREPAVLSLTDVASGETIFQVSSEAIGLELAERAARQLAPIRDISELARAGDIPKRVGLLELLDMLPPSARELEHRWATWRGELRATVGVASDGPLSLDLRAEGPHALIAGTTGSGKSELLRTLVAAAAAEIPPNRLSFLLVDYKGGAAFAPCAALPHVVDIVSDLDEHLAERALVSLNAELKRRERILAAEGAKDLLELTHRDPEAAPPLLVIAVDEFAKLREEVPEFVDGVVDIAQRGRSLGVHMVLAAQTLRNAFTPAIRANTNLRLALRVSEEAESEDMIASPLAARIPSGESSRGRAFARTGHGELREFQSAYISGLSDISRASELRIARFDLDVLSGADQEAPQGSDSDSKSDLVVLSDAAREAHHNLRLPTPVAPWLPMLSEIIPLDDLPEAGADDGAVPIGLVDLPEVQRQDPLLLDLTNSGHVAVFGAGNSGKTTALTTAALALARSGSPEQINIYCLDAAGGNLTPLADLPHCGGVVMVEEEERVHRLMRLLMRRVERRGARTSSLTDRATDPRMTVLLIDDFASFAYVYDKPGVGSPFELLQLVLSGGRAAGVHVILTASRRGAVPAALATHIGQRLVLRMPSEEDMLSLGLNAKTIRGARLPVGSGFTQETKEFHIAVHGSEGHEVPLAQGVAACGGGDSRRAEPVDVLPTEVARDCLDMVASLDAVPLGVSDDHLGVATVDVSELHFLVVGSYRSGRSTGLATLAHGIHAAAQNAELYLMAPRRSPLRELPTWTAVATTSQECAALAGTIVERMHSLEPDDPLSFLFVDDAGEVSDALTVNSLEQIVRTGRERPIRVLAAAESSSARGIGLAWLRDLRRDSHGLLLQPELATDGDLLGTRLPRRVSAPLTTGRGFLVVRGVAELVQVAC